MCVRAGEVMTEDRLLVRLRSLRCLPTLPAVLAPLLRHVERPQESQNMHEIVRLIASDQSLAAHCLQIANSPLDGVAREIESIQAAVIALGLTPPAPPTTARQFPHREEARLHMLSKRRETRPLQQIRERPGHSPGSGPRTLMG